jgi:integrase
MTASLRLTDTKLRQLKDVAKSKKHSDGRGLYLHQTPDGGKRWRFKYRFEGKEKLLALGTYPDVSLADARDRLSDARSQLAKGIDPSAARQAAKTERREKLGNTFRSFAERWFEQGSTKWAESTKSKIRFYLDRDLLPKLGDMPIADIRRPALIETLRSIEERDAIDVAKKCRSWLLGIFRYAVVSGVIEQNPATDLHIVAKAAPQRRGHPHVTMSELPSFLRALAAYGGDPATRYGLELLTLTAVRPGELRAAQWSEFDLDAGVWSIPAERMKMRRAHVVPLPVQAVAALRALLPLTGSGALVFPSRDSKKRPISDNTWNAAIARLGYKGRQTGHGFRHLVSTALNERGFNRDWIERQLSHGDDDSIRGIYNAAQYLEQRRAMMQQWADELDALRDNRKVIAGNFGRAA